MEAPLLGFAGMYVYSLGSQYTWLAGLLCCNEGLFFGCDDLLSMTSFVDVAGYDESTEF